MLGSMSQHLRVLVGLVEDMTLKDVETRFVNWLVKRLPRDARGEIPVELGMTKRVLAGQLGTSSETLSRTFARLRDQDLLDVKATRYACVMSRHFSLVCGACWAKPEDRNQALHQLPVARSAPTA